MSIYQNAPNPGRSRLSIHDDPNATAYEQVTRTRLEHVERTVDRLENKLNAILVGILFTIGTQVVSMLLK